jgi:hypothetical protein
MIPNMRTLRVTDLGETAEENAQVTLSAMTIKMTAAVDGEIQGRPCKMTTIFFLEDSQPAFLALSDFDLLQIESVIGAYGFYEGHD